jgi:pimeloyl-ACP methyl ester carboxylesterase
MPSEKLPLVPFRPHSYFALASREVAVKHPARPVPIRLHCKIAGQGPPLLLIHGLMTSSYSFRYVIPALAARYQVIVPDLPGAGRSETLLPEVPVSARAIGQLIAALIGALDIEPPFVVGNSLGGYQALWCAVLFPDQVRKLIIMHAPGFPQVRLSLLLLLLASPAGRSLMRWRLRRDPEGFAAHNIHYHDASLMSREEAAEYGAIFRDPARTELFIRILRESFDPADRRELEERLAEIRSGQGRLPPVRLLWARQDTLVPPDFGWKYQKLLPTAELVWFEGASHFLQVDAPERTVEEIMRFAV